jgi:hypothetical protein
MQSFVDWCTKQGADWQTDLLLDHWLVVWFDELFFRGHPVADGTKALAAIKYYVPRVSRTGPGSLPRALRAVASWTKAAPPRQRLPLPAVVLAAMVGAVMSSGWIHAQETALRWWLAFRCYLRPGESDKMTVSSLVAPSSAAGPQYVCWGLHLHPAECGGLPGKTGLFDEAVLFDTELRLGHLLYLLQVNRCPTDPLWMVTAEEDIRRFNLIAETLHLEPLAPSRYGLRHAGASEDLLTGRRAALDVKRRGRWRADSSLRRYGKETRLQAELQKVSPTVIAFGRQVMDQIENVILSQVQVAIPSSIQAPKSTRKRPRE